ncbi:MAG: hypothetical protein GY852_09825, partial [bacterium]|nr:hypothetical protein [bacterium]
MKTIFILALTILSLLLFACESAGPSINSEFPVFMLQCVNTGGPPTACDFLGGDGDGLAAANTYLYFIDRDAGYVKAEVALGVPVTDVGSSPEGGYGLAIAGNVLYVVSNDIYTVHEQILLPEVG